MTFSKHTRKTREENAPEYGEERPVARLGAVIGTNLNPPIEENPMNANRLMLALAVIAVITIAVATTSFAPAPRAAAPYDDFALRHPYGLPVITANVAAYYRALDSAQRNPAAAIDLSDYALRHPELQVPDRTDFFLRHPTWTTLSPVFDTSDYYLRHPELWSQ